MHQRVDRTSRESGDLLVHPNEEELLVPEVTGSGHGRLVRRPLCEESIHLGQQLPSLIVVERSLGCEDPQAGFGWELVELGDGHQSIPTSRWSQRTYPVINVICSAVIPSIGSMLPNRQWWAFTPMVTARWKAKSA